MIRQGFSDNTIKAFQADLRLFSKYHGRQQADRRASGRPISSGS